jgi:hypothetical protein
MNASGQPGNHDPSWYPTPHTPEEIYQWLGVRFAMLETPRFRARTFGRFSETIAADDLGPPPRLWTYPTVDSAL